MQEAIEALFSDRRKDDLVVLYFSGHGIKDESGKLYLATRLTRKNPQGQLVRATAVPASFVHNIMSDSRCKRQVIILDCCFSTDANNKVLSIEWISLSQVETQQITLLPDKKLQVKGHIKFTDKSGRADYNYTYEFVNNRYENLKNYSKYDLVNK